MFQRPTVFIVGAGCSAEFGLPLGTGLRDVIVERLPSRNDWESTEQKVLITSALQEAGGSGWTHYLDACDRIKRGLHYASSIDRFLDFHQEDERLVQAGKIGIAQSILMAEADSQTLKIFRGHLDPARLHNTWLYELFILMQEGVKRSNLEEVFKNVTFICFNYDRCIEHYFLYAVKAFAGLSDSEAASVVKSLRILHPYGRVGGLEWDARPGEPVLSFGQEFLGGAAMNRVAKGIRTFAERIEESDELEQIRGAVQSARQIVFLGFGYLDQNMDLLRPANSCSGPEVHGTVFGQSQQNVDLAVKSIKRMLKGSTPGPKGFPPDNVIATPALASSTAAGFLQACGNRLRR